jgi:putative transposase
MVLINWYNTKRTESCFRLVKVEDTKGNVLQLIINRFDLSADEISEMYKSRWPLNYFSNG